MYSAVWRENMLIFSLMLIFVIKCQEMFLKNVSNTNIITGVKAFSWLSYIIFRRVAHGLVWNWWKTRLQCSEWLLCHTSKIQKYYIFYNKRKILDFFFAEPKSIFNNDFKFISILSLSLILFFPTIIYNIKKKIIIISNYLVSEKCHLANKNLLKILLFDLFSS